MWCCSLQLYICVLPVGTPRQTHQAVQREFFFKKSIWSHVGVSRVDSQFNELQMLKDLPGQWGQLGVLGQVSEEEKKKETGETRVTNFTMTTGAQSFFMFAGVCIMPVGLIRFILISCPASTRKRITTYICFLQEMFLFLSHLTFVNIITVFVINHVALWPLSKTICESEWMFVPNLRKFPQGAAEISHPQDRDGRLYLLLVPSHKNENR